MAIAVDSWTCMVCFERKPDHLIGVVTAAHRSFGSEVDNFASNVRYCLDKPSCLRDARDKAKEQISTMVESFSGFYPRGEVIETE